MVLLSHVLKKKFSLFIIAIMVTFYLYLYRSMILYQMTYRQSVPLILLFTRNHSAKTRVNICQGTRNGGHVVSFHSCPVKCEFSCRIDDFQQRSPHALLFFGEDFAWPFQITNQNRTSLNQRWIFWSWEAPIHHPEYTRSGLTFNWYEIRSTLSKHISFHLGQ